MGHQYSAKVCTALHRLRYETAPTPLQYPKQLPGRTVSAVCKLRPVRLILYSSSNSWGHILGWWGRAKSSPARVEQHNGGGGATWLSRCHIDSAEREGAASWLSFKNYGLHLPERHLKCFCRVAHGEHHLHAAIGLDGRVLRVDAPVRDPREAMRRHGLVGLAELREYNRHAAADCLWGGRPR